jgi:hypothetical protein
MRRRLASCTKRPATDVSQPVEMHAFCTATDATQDDLVLGEGQAVMFLDPEEALAHKLGVTAALILPAFLS